MFDNVRVYFDDGTSTVIHISEDENIEDKIVDLCEDEGWNVSDVTGWVLQGEYMPMWLH